MQKTIKAMETKYLQPSLEMIEDVFTKWDSPEEGKMVRSLVEEMGVCMISTVSSSRRT